MLQGREAAGAAVLVEQADSGADSETVAGEVCVPVGQVAPGPGLALLLDGVDLDEVDDADLAGVLAGFERLVSWAHAGAARVAEEVSRRVSRASGMTGTDDGTGRFSAAAHEVALALGWSRASAARLITEGRALGTTLCDVGANLEAGALTVSHARVLVGRLADQPWQVAHRVLDVVLDGAAELTPHALGVAVDRALCDLEPQVQADLAAAARDGRRVGRPCPAGRGMASLTATLPVVDAARVDAVLEQVARGARSAGDPRTLAQLRADVLVDVLTGDVQPAGDAQAAGELHSAGVQVAGESLPVGTVVVDASQATARARSQAARPLSAGLPATSSASLPAASSVLGIPQAGPAPARSCATGTADSAVSTGTSQPGSGASRRSDRHSGWRLPPPGSVQVNVTVSAASLLGVTDDPAQVPGVGAVDAVTARALARGGVWRRIVTDPATGAVLDVGRTRYRPPAALAAHITARDPHCVCGACALPADRCDLDHTTEWHDGGTTTADNLAPLCRAAHTLKTDGYLRLSVTGLGQYAWTSPLGNRYRVDTTTGIPRRTPAAAFPDVPPF